MPNELHFLTSSTNSIIFRFQKVQAHKKEINLANSTEIESQATKRQKLDGGLLHKVR
jgi:hypothetical protein